MLPRVCNYLAVTVLFCAVWRCGLAGPVAARDSSLSLTGTCNALARSLLWNATDALAMDHLFNGFNCTQQSAQVHLRTQTLSACTPKDSTCSYSTVHIDENECLQRILEDLRYYEEIFRAYSNPELTKTVVKSIDDLMQNCFSVSPMDNSQLKVSMDHQKSFQERLQLCKVLKGFHLRVITINRVFNFILSK